MERSRKIIFAPSAFADLEQGYEYIRQDNRKAAEVWLAQIFESVEKLARFPKMGRMIPEMGYARYREIILGEYRIFHEVTETEIRIFRVLHSKRLFP